MNLFRWVLPTEEKLTLSSGQTCRKLVSRVESGQALIEFALILLPLVALALGVIEMANLIYDQQVLTHLSREGSNLASRNTSLTNTVTALLNEPTPFNLSTAGCVIVTQIANTGSGSGSSGTYVIQAQQSVCAISATSRVGTGIGTTATGLPTAAEPQAGQSVYATEVFYRYTPLTPVGQLLKITLPSQLYDVAYF